MASGFHPCSTEIPYDLLSCFLLARMISHARRPVTLHNRRIHPPWPRPPAVRFVPVEFGQRRLLDVGSGATTLLSALDEAQCEQAIVAVAPGLGLHPRLDVAALSMAVRLSQKTGFAISQGTVVADGFGLGLALPSARRTPSLALSIAEQGSVVTELLISLWMRVLLHEAKSDAALPPLR